MGEEQQRFAAALQRAQPPQVILDAGCADCAVDGLARFERLVTDRVQEHRRAVAEKLTALNGERKSGRGRSRFLRQAERRQKCAQGCEIFEPIQTGCERQHVRQASTCPGQLSLQKLARRSPAARPAARL